VLEVEVACEVEELEVEDVEELEDELELLDELVVEV